MSMVNINERKAIKFYSEIISLYPHANSLWGSKTEFLDSLKNAAYIGSDKDYEVDFSKIKISFSKPIFDILFLGKTVVDFDKPIGKRLEIDNYIYLELRESPLINLNSKEDSGLFSLSKNSLSKKRYYWGYFFINEDSREDLYYPEEILLIFICQLKERLIKNYAFDLSTGIYTNFCALFKPIDYILKVRKNKEALQEKLLYRLCIDLGLIEHKIQTTFKIDVSQDINEIYDKTTNSFLLSNKKQYDVNSLKFFTSAMENSDPCYQFLELYHSLESYFYKYFYKYIQSLKKVKTKKDFKQIQKHTKENKMLKLVIKDISDKFPNIEQQISKITNINQFCENFLPEQVNLNGLNKCNEDKFSNKVADFIYSIRNNIVHTKEPHRTISDLSESEQKILIEINRLLLFIVREVFSKNIEW